MESENIKPSCWLYKLNILVYILALTITIRPLAMKTHVVYIYGNKLNVSFICPSDYLAKSKEKFVS